MLYHGKPTERQDLRDRHLQEVHTIDDVFSSPRSVKNIFVTSYEIAMSDKATLRRTNWRYIVVDEGHRLKNRHVHIQLTTYLVHTTLKDLLSQN